MNDSGENRNNETVAIVGGGITGLFCAYILAGNGRMVHLFEAAERLGGRIETIRLGKENTVLEKNWERSDIEFCAEFGPMRIELDKQLLVAALLEHLAITTKTDSGEGKVGAAAAYLNPFPAYASPAATSDPKYQLRPDELGKTPLQLLEMAMLRVATRMVVVGGDSKFKELQDELKSEITLAGATGRDWAPIFEAWLEKLNPTHHWDIQVLGKVDGIPLYQMGFWNLLSDNLSHDAVTMLRDLGTFYHLLPENPNAAEWFIWWLIGFSISGHLQGIFGGMQCIIDQLLKQLEAKQLKENAGLFVRARVIAVKRVETSAKYTLRFEQKGRKFPRPHAEYDRVIFALPKSPLEKIVRRSERVFEGEKEMLKLLDSAFGFPMVKVFVVVTERWWEEENRANRYATRLPTRELHYWKGKTKESRQGLIMLYTDRPASSFWANYVAPGPQDKAVLYEARPKPGELGDRLTKKVVQYLNEHDAPGIRASDIVWYGIRDWGREPFGGANHAWRPERRYWVVMARLAEIRDVYDEKRTLHVCGEAYSDYHGFIEGSLRSAVYVLHRIFANEPGRMDLEWLKTAGLGVDSKYLESLRRWATGLEGSRSDPFM
jgi:monoamine oxidase